MEGKSNGAARIELISPSTQYARCERLFEKGSILVRSDIAKDTA
jgi:hypothetical protein